MSTSDRGILDTSTVVLLERIEDPRSLPPEPLITAITLAELSVGPLVATILASGNAPASSTAGRGRLRPPSL